MILVYSCVLYSFLMAMCAGDVRKKKDQAICQPEGVSCYELRELRCLPVIESLTGRCWRRPRGSTSAWVYDPPLAFPFVRSSSFLVAQRKGVVSVGMPAERKPFFLFEKECLEFLFWSLS